MAQFSISYQFTMGNEGGYANNPGDPGGETYKGIARNYWGAWPGWPAVDAAVQNNPNTINSVLATNTVLQGQVQMFYQQNFWNPELLDNVNDQQVANQVFDIAVNMGTGTAGTILQRAVNTLTGNALNVDGAVGPLTLAAVNAAPAPALYGAICTLRTANYHQIVTRNPSMAQFLPSWLSRMPPYQS